MPDWRPTATLATLRARADLLAAIRSFFAAREVLEVDTPLLAAAAPSEAQLACFPVGTDAGYLVPSPEHAMKRLLAAGSGSIYQLGHVFRAGEVGRWHNPEFTMLEWYRPGWSMAELIVEVDAFMTHVGGAPALEHTTFAAEFFAHTGLDAHQATAAELAAWADANALAPAQVATCERHSRAFWLDLIMCMLITPTLGMEELRCVEGFPADAAVMVELSDDETHIAKRFKICWGGQELANGAQELTAAGAARARMQLEQQRGTQAG